MLCLSFYEWRCIDAGEQMLLAPFLGKASRDRAPERLEDFMFAPEHAKADVLLTTNMGPLCRELSLVAKCHGDGYCTHWLDAQGSSPTCVCHDAGHRGW